MLLHFWHLWLQLKGMVHLSHHKLMLLLLQPLCSLSCCPNTCCLMHVVTHTCMSAAMCLLQNCKSWYPRSYMLLCHICCSVVQRYSSGTAGYVCNLVVASCLVLHQGYQLWQSQELFWEVCPVGHAGYVHVWAPAEVKLLTANASPLVWLVQKAKVHSAGQML